MLHTGVDIVEIWRIGEAVARWGDRFFNRIYTPGELAYARGRLPQLAGRFAAKEAVMKALGTGVRGVGWREIEVVRKPGQAPTVVLHGRARARAEWMQMGEISISISHSRDYAVVVAVGETSEDSNG
ncbi:MAG: holo-ACP synthase [Chloroflexota bacterium]|nr:holo-ACP synthase [Chloroflexota bacterium]